MCILEIVDNCARGVNPHENGGHALVDEAKKTKLDVEYVSGEELQSLAEKMLNQPPGVVTRVKKILGKK